MIETADVFNHLVGVDNVERSILEGPVLIEVGDANVEASRPCKLDAVRHEFQSENLFRWHAQPMSHELRPRAVVTTHIEQPSGGLRANRVQDLLAI